MDARRREKNTAMLEWFDALLFALTLVLVILLFVVRTVTVVGSSMIPTLTDGEQLFARSLFYTPQRGDVVVIDGYTSYGEPLVKRVIGVEGDVVDIDFETGEVMVNGEVMDEPYISEPTTRGYDVAFPVTVPDGTVFLLGDNRPYSRDSRDSSIGFIDVRDVLGKVVFRILPADKMGPVQ